MTTCGDTPKDRWFGYKFTEYELAQQALALGRTPDHEHNARWRMQFLLFNSGLVESAHFHRFSENGVRYMLLALATNAPRHVNNLVPQQEPEPEVYAKLMKLLGTEEPPKWYEICFNY